MAQPRAGSCGTLKSQPSGKGGCNNYNFSLIIYFVWRQLPPPGSRYAGSWIACPRTAHGRLGYVIDRLCNCELTTAMPTAVETIAELISERAIGGKAIVYGYSVDISVIFLI